MVIIFAVEMHIVALKLSILVNTFTAEPENTQDTFTHSAVLFPRILGLEIQWSAAIYRSRFVIFILYTTKLHALGNTVESSLVVFHCFPDTRDG